MSQTKVPPPTRDGPVKYMACLRKRVLTDGGLGGKSGILAQRVNEGGPRYLSSRSMNAMVSRVGQAALSVPLRGCRGRASGWGGGPSQADVITEEGVLEPGTVADDCVSARCSAHCCQPAHGSCQDAELQSAGGAGRGQSRS